MTDYELEKINAERRRNGLPALSRSQAQSAISSAPSSSDSGFDMMHFLIGYTTGIPMPSAGGIIGAMMHPTPAAADTSSSYSAPDPAPSSSLSYDSGSSSSSSSYDSGSSSSSSSDSGGSW